MDARRKRTALILIGLAAALIVLLAAGLPRLQLLPGRPFSLGEETPPIPGSGLPGNAGQILLMAFRGLLALAMLALPVYILISLLTPEGRKRLLADLVTLVILLTASYLFSRLVSRVTPQPLRPAQAGAAAAVTPQAPLPVEQFSPQSSPWLVWIASALLVLLLVGAAAALTWLGLRRRRKLRLTPAELLAEQAKAAVDELQAGGDLKGIILRCYRKMSQVLLEERGLQRGLTMTASEFAAALVEKGLPAGPVDGLTRLFEAARYSSAAPSPGDEAQALDSLQQIVAACRSLDPAGRSSGGAAALSGRAE